MKTLLAVFMKLIVLTVSASPAIAQNQGGNLEGNWLGALDVGGVKMRLVLKVAKTIDGYTAKLDGIDQGAKDLPIDSVSLNGNKMSFVAAQIGMRNEVYTTRPTCARALLLRSPVS